MLRRVAVVHLWTFSVVDADDVVAADADLDDAIRNLFSAAESFDRDNLGAGTVATLFPRGGFSSIIDLPLAQEPDSADALATKEESLGAAHALAPHAAKLKAQSSKLKAQATAVRAAITAQETAIRTARTAAAEEENAQGALRRADGGNYLVARSSFGRTVAEIEGHELRDLVLGIQDIAIKWLRSLPSKFRAIVPTNPGTLTSIRLTVFGRLVPLFEWVQMEDEKRPLEIYSSAFTTVAKFEKSKIIVKP